MEDKKLPTNALNDTSFRCCVFSKAANVLFSNGKHAVHSDIFERAGNLAHVTQLTPQRFCCTCVRVFKFDLVKTEEGQNS